MSKKCFIFGALEINHKIMQPDDGDFVIACDRGLLNTQKFNIVCDAVIGDFDSLGYCPNNDNVIILPTHKDDTDIGYAIKYAVERGYTVFYIYGAVGGRYDMTFANLQLASFLSKKGCFAFFFGKHQSFTVITDSSVYFPKAEGRVSVFSVSDSSEGVDLINLEYELNNATLTPFYPLGVSNSFIGKESVISVRNGTLAIFFEGDIIPERR